LKEFVQVCDKKALFRNLKIKCTARSTKLQMIFVSFSNMHFFQAISWLNLWL
jgi:hypothetical protein